MKHIGVDVSLKQTDGDRQLSNQGTSRVDTASRLPVMRAVTSLANGRITVRTRCVMCEPTFIDADNDPACCFMGGDLVLEDAPCVCVCFGMCQCFFYRSRQVS